MLKLDFPALSALAAASAAATQDCACTQTSFSCWESVPPSLDQGLLAPVGTLFDDPYVEPTFVEYHPAGTRYDSLDAPIAPRYYPYNRCEVHACRACGRHYLRYSEAGGYFTDARIRALQAALLADAPL